MWQVEGKQRGYREHPSFVLCFWFVLSSYHSFVCSFIHSFISFFPICLFVIQKLPWSQRFGRETVSEKKKDFPPRFLSLFRFLPGIPVPSFYSLRSFVIFGRVSDTLVCLGNRVEGKSRTAVRGSRDTRGSTRLKRVDEGEERVKK